MKLKSTIAILIVLAISGCSDNNEKLVGIYKYKHSLSGTEKISEVRKDGDTYLFIEDVIRNSNAIPLTANADGLSYRDMPLKLSSDGKTLYFSSINAARVDQNYLSSIRSAIEKEKKECADLQGEFNKNSQSISPEKWNDFIKETRNKIPKNCRIQGADMRW